MSKINDNCDKCVFVLFAIVAYYSFLIAKMDLNVL